jgi:hypothetical protein
MPQPRFDPTINLGHILTFLGFMAAGFGAYSSVRAEMAVYQVQIGGVEKRLDTLSTVVIQNTRLEVEVSEMRRRLERFENAPR